MKKKWLIVLAVTLLTLAPALAACAPGAGQNAGAQTPEGGSAAPDFTLQNLDGQKMSLSDFKGRPVLINFWATWCPPCRYEMPFLQAIHEDPAWKERGLVILGINIEEDEATVSKFMTENRLDFTILMDTRGEVTRRYNIGPIPATFIVDKDGIIRGGRVGAFQDKAHIDRLLKDVLK